MKLQTQFTVPNKELKDLDYSKKVDFLEETLNKNLQITQIKKIAWFDAIKNQKIVVFKSK